MAGVKRKAKKSAVKPKRSAPRKALESDGKNGWPSPFPQMKPARPDGPPGGEEPTKPANPGA